MVVDNSGTVSSKEWVTSEERVLVKKFQAEVSDFIPAEELARSEDDLMAFLLRWLRARELNVDKAAEMFKQAVTWREENHLELALTRDIDPFMIENYQWKFLTADYEGRPVGICPFYAWDFRKMLTAKKQDQFEIFLQYFFESLLKEIREHNDAKKEGQAPVTQFMPILDVSGFPYGQLLNITAMRKWFQLAGTYESKFPEILYRVICINCPGYFQMFLNMLKGFLAPRTLNKFICYSSVDGWKKDISNYLDSTAISAIPEEYGGTCKVNPLKGN